VDRGVDRGDASPPPDQEQDDGEATIREHRRAGRLLERVHVVVEPLTDYVRYELTWAYAPNVAAAASGTDPARYAPDRDPLAG
jgi:hypothetical protein